MTGRAPEIIASHHSCQLRICCSSPHLGHQGQREASPYFKDKTEDALPGGSFKQSFIVGPLCCVAVWPGRHAAREIAPTRVVWWGVLFYKMYSGLRRTPLASGLVVRGLNIL